MRDGAALDAFRQSAAVFWDFDGVIKESVRAKADAYVALFEDAPVAVRDRVRAHHNAHGGMSRFEKIPLYLDFAGRSSSEVPAMLDRFAARVVDEVIAAPWVAGVEELLRGNAGRRAFFVVTGTPTDEMNAILRALGLEDVFVAVRGAPEPKTDAVAACLSAHGLAPGDCVFIGDAGSDLQAAKANGTGFILRCTDENTALRQGFAGPQTEDFSGWTEQL